MISGRAVQDHALTGAAHRGGSDKGAYGTPGLKPCGTEAAYYRHRRNNEPACDPCRAAHSAYRKQYRKQRRERGERKWTVSDRVRDWLEADGGWLTDEGIAADLNHSAEVVLRELRRLRREGVVERRTIDLGYAHRGGYQARTEWRVV